MAVALEPQDLSLSGSDRLAESQRPQGNVGHTLARVVLEHGNLLRARHPFALSREKRAQLNQPLPLENSFLHRIKDVALLVLNRLLHRRYPKYVGAPERGVIQLAPLGAGETAFHAPDVAADNARDMNPRCEPVAVKDRHAGVGGG